jgi:hypothetical protein
MPGLVDPQSIPDSPADLIEPRTKAAALFVVLGGAVVILGSFLPWASVTTVFGTIGRTGMEGGDGVITLLLGLSIVGCGITAATNPKFWWRVPVLLGAAVAAFAWFEYRDIAAKLAALAPNPYVAMSTGAGIWVLHVGALVTVCGATSLGRKS